MSKGLFLLGFLALLAASCGKKDSIKVETNVEMLGDGEHVTQTVVLPLSDKVVGTYDDSTENLQPLVRGLLRSVMDIGASLGAGKTRLSLTQRLPEEIPDVIGSVKIKRLFFLIDEKNDETKKKKKDGKLSFDFLSALAVKMNIERHEFKEDTWEPVITNSALDKKDRGIFNRLPDFEIFKREDKTTLEEWNYASDGLMVLNYKGAQEPKKNKEEKSLFSDGSTKKHGNIYVLDTDLPVETRDFFMNKESEFKPFIKKAIILNKTLIIEVKNDPIDESLFGELLVTKAEKFNYLVKNTKMCENNCLDFELADFNLIPFLKKGNALRVDAFIDPGKAPPSFQLKGYIEFEIKVKAKL